TSSVISGILSLSNTAHNFNVADGAAADDLLVNAVVLGGNTGTAGVSLLKNGTGLMALTGANAYTGRTQAAFGVLDVRNGFALGAADGTTNTDTLVNAGATLRLNAAGGAAVAVGNEGLTLTGTIIGSGASLADTRLITLDSSSGNNSWAGNITLASAATLGGVVVATRAAGAGLSLGGAIGQTGTIPVGLTFTGTGTAELAGTAANTFRGVTSVETGTLSLNKTAGVAAIPAGLLIG